MIFSQTMNDMVKLCINNIVNELQVGIKAAQFINSTSLVYFIQFSEHEYLELSFKAVFIELLPFRNNTMIHIGKSDGNSFQWKQTGLSESNRVNLSASPLSSAGLRSPCLPGIGGALYLLQSRLHSSLSLLHTFSNPGHMLHAAKENWQKNFFIRGAGDQIEAK